MALNQDLPAEQGATPATVVAGLGYPNGRAEISPTPTGWHASKAASDGSAHQSFATVDTIRLTATAGEGTGK